MAYDFNNILPHRSTWILERTLWREGKRYVVGIDEVGRGPIAGPMVAAAVVLPVNCDLKGLDDSKQLSESKRESLAQLIKNTCTAYVIVKAEYHEIDRNGVGEANRRLFRKCFDKLLSSLKLPPTTPRLRRTSRQKDRMTGHGLDTTPCFLAIDGRSAIKLPVDYEYIIDGDARVKSIAAASILAKVFRDQLMKEYHDQYPEYGFGRIRATGRRITGRRLIGSGRVPFTGKVFWSSAAFAKAKEV